MVELCLRLGGIPSPAGHERECGQAVVDWLKANGIDAYLGEWSVGATDREGFTQYIWIDQELKKEMRI